MSIHLTQKQSKQTDLLKPRIKDGIQSCKTIIGNKQEKISQKYQIMTTKKKQLLDRMKILEQKLGINNQNPEKYLCQKIKINRKDQSADHLKTDKRNLQEKPIKDQHIIKQQFSFGNPSNSNPQKKNYSGVNHQMDPINLPKTPHSTFSKKLNFTQTSQKQKNKISFGSEGENGLRKTINGRKFLKSEKISLSGKSSGNIKPSSSDVNSTSSKVRMSKDEDFKKVFSNSQQGKYQIYPPEMPEFSSSARQQNNINLVQSTSNHQSNRIVKFNGLNPMMMTPKGDHNQQDHNNNIKEQQGIKVTLGKNGGNSNKLFYINKGNNGDHSLHQSFGFGPKSLKIRYDNYV